MTKASASLLQYSKGCDRTVISQLENQKDRHRQSLLPGGLALLVDQLCPSSTTASPSGVDPPRSHFPPDPRHREHL